MNSKNMRAKLIVSTVVDENLNPVFTVSDVEALGNKSSAALDRVYGVAQKLCGISDSDMEELEKN